MRSELTTWELRYGYLCGAFVMGDAAGELNWYKPDRRALFPIEGARVSRTLKAVLRRGAFEVTADRRFEDVVRGCLREADNWITEELIRAYMQAHVEGWAHSVEVYQGERLVGGLFGLAIGSVFSAESMFHAETNASKVALVEAVHLCRSLGFQVFDAQIPNPHLESMGSFDISQEEYESLLARWGRVRTPWDRCPFDL